MEGSAEAREGEAVRARKSEEPSASARGYRQTLVQASGDSHPVKQKVEINLKHTPCALG